MHDGKALLGELDRKVAEPAEDGEDFGADVRGEVEHALKEQVIQPVELILQQVLVVEIHAVLCKCVMKQPPFSFSLLYFNSFSSCDHHVIT